jgi:hypothetical protein
MTLNELIALAASGYPDGLPLEYWDAEHCRPSDNPDAGDTLAFFVARELQDTFDPDVPEEMQLEMAAHALERAANELLLTTAAIRDGLPRAEQTKRAA